MLLSRHHKAGKLPARKAHVKHVIQLEEGPVPRLRKLKVDDHNRDQASGGVDPADLAAEVSLVRVEHIRHNDGPNSGEEVVEGKTDGLGFGAETRDGHFAGDAGCGADDGTEGPPC